MYNWRVVYLRPEREGVVPASEAWIPEARRRLVDDHFPWDEVGTRPEMWEDRLSEVYRWLEQHSALYRLIATGLLARVEPILDQLQAAVLEVEPDRLFVKVDASHITKSPESILEKMARKWPGLEQAPPVSFHNVDQLNDLGRFRIVANFLGDVDDITRHLSEPYDARKASLLTPAQRLLRDEFTLHDNRFEDLILVPPNSRTSGERCRKGRFSPRQPELRGHQVEVQIVTLLQEAWDKKDHCLIYERVRRGEHVPLMHQIICTDLSAQLFVADSQFEQLRREGLPRREESTGTSELQENQRAPA
ncbi:RelA/SpoT domain-containing protein [Myxococcus stipitatus]|uniref:RelA/SpoT domain-containing protein n=1 Tax=Myxococcus stipitatus TaxID=83455 RepID=UPI003144F16B